MKTMSYLFTFLSLLSVSAHADYICNPSESVKAVVTALQEVGLPADVNTKGLQMGEDGGLWLSHDFNWVSFSGVAVRPNGEKYIILAQLYCPSADDIQINGATYRPL